MRLFVVAPYVGEFGWEVISWEPLVRRAWMDGGLYDRAIVFSGPGRRLLYPWANEVRTLPDIPVHEAECLLWHDWDEEKKNIVNDLIKRAVDEVMAEYPPKINQADVFSYGCLQKYNDQMYARGEPDLLQGDGIELLPESERGCVVLCVRDRSMSEYRNWRIEKWCELASLIEAAGYKAVVIGKVRDQDAWNHALLSTGAFDLINLTTVDDLIRIFSSDRCKLAIGGNTGTIHLASRCALPHLVWGGEKVVIRVAETNWFGAPHHVMMVGWNPKPESVTEKAVKFLETGSWEKKDA